LAPQLVCTVTAGDIENPPLHPDHAVPDVLVTFTDATKPPFHTEVKVAEYAHPATTAGLAVVVRGEGVCGAREAPDRDAGGDPGGDPGGDEEGELGGDADGPLPAVAGDAAGLVVTVGELAPVGVSGQVDQAPSAPSSTEVGAVRMTGGGALSGVWVTLAATIAAASPSRLITAGAHENSRRRDGDLRRDLEPGASPGPISAWSILREPRVPCALLTVHLS
jgi:hypothetical protein